MALDIGAPYNIVCRLGHTIGPIEVVWTDDADAPVPLGAVTFDSSIFQDKNSIIKVAEFDVQVIVANDGSFSFGMDAADVATLSLHTYQYILSATINGVREPLLYGSLEVRQG
jgi:hypothetical protein